MPTNNALEDTALIDQAATWLRERLPSNWTVERSNREIVTPGSTAPQRIDAAIDVRAPNGTYTTFAVEAKQSFRPRDVDRLLPGLTRLLRTLAGNVPVLVVAPWLSGRSQDLLERDGINFLDLTGNALIRLDNPAVYIRADGAARNPQPEPRSSPSVRGPKAGRLIRLLADVRPPYGVREMASAADLTPGYVSRLLDTLDREALVERSPRGEVESVEVAGLLRRWAESYDVLKTNEARNYIAPTGATSAVQRLVTASLERPVAITGSFAAVRLAPVAAPALLLAYSYDIDETAATLDLLPADEGANVVLLRPFDRVVWERATSVDGLTYVSLSQVVVDCLTGTGRMPAEGDALLTWMTENEPSWRLNSLDEADRPGGKA
jgi:hypothetical protein